MLILFQQIANGLVTGCIYALTALGLTMIFGIMNIINFAHGEIYMLGAYLAYGFCVSMGFPYLLSIVFAMLAVGVIGILRQDRAHQAIQRFPITRPPGDTELSFQYIVYRFNFFLQILNAHFSIYRL